ncbi:MAG: protein DpdD [Dehalococcoidia bacterium]
MSIIDAFFGEANDLDPSSMSEDAARMLAPWIDRWEQGKGPTFLPRLFGGELTWYGLANSEQQRRELETLLGYWVGPSCSNMGDRRGVLDIDDPFDQRIQEGLPRRVVKLQVLPRASDNADGHRRSRDRVHRRLKALVKLLDARPERPSGVGRQLSDHLDDVYLRASHGDVRGAQDLVDELQRRKILDAPNTAFVRIRARSLAGDHVGLLASEELQELDGQVLPRGVALAIRDAVLDVNEKPSLTPDLVESQQPHVRRALQSVLSPSTSTLPQPVRARGDSDAVATAKPEPLIDQSPVDELPAANSLVGEPSVAYRVEEHSEVAEVTKASADTAPEAQTLDAAVAFRMWQTQQDAELVESVAKETEFDAETLNFAVYSADRLGDSEAAERVLEAIEHNLGPPGSVAWGFPGTAEVVERLLLSRGGVVDSWTAWFDAVVGGAAVPEQQLADSADWPPLGPAEVKTRIGQVGPGVLVPLLGTFLPRHRAQMTSSQRADVAVPLLEALALSGRAGPDVRAWTSLLVDDALSGSLDQEERSDLLDVCGLVVDEHLAPGTIGWATDLLGDLVDEFGGVSRDALAAMLATNFATFRQLGGALRRSTRESLAALAEQAGTDLPGDLAPLEETEPDPLACYAGRSVLIYSLFERSARQAAARLGRVKDVDVVLSHEHAGTARLAQQAANANVVVIVTAAGKHAATEFIEEYVTGELIRVNTKGASGLIAEMERACG